MTITFSELDHRYMLRALELARRGEGFVEPNPMVGCVIARGDAVLSEGFHAKFGGPHAEAAAIADARRKFTNGSANATAENLFASATLYVTLEPCCHYGKTPPCVEAILAAGIRRVVAAMRDPFPKVAGGGFAALQAAGVQVEVGLHEEAARRLTAPFCRLIEQSRPWVHAKWAMTLDGKLATRTGNSRWISNDESREVVHRLRGRMDAIIVGRGTVAADDPLLTARPPGARIAARIVLDSRATLSEATQLVRTAANAPVIVAASREATEENKARLAAHGVEVVVCEGNSRNERWQWLLQELGRRQMTNVLVEGGANVFGTAFDTKTIDEVHVFVAPKLLGGATAPSPIGGAGLASMRVAVTLSHLEATPLGDNVYYRGNTT